MTSFRKIQAIVLAVLTASTLTIVGTQGADAASAPTTTQEFVRNAAPTHFKAGLGRVTRAEAIRYANQQDLIIAHWYSFEEHVGAMKSANPDLTILVYQKGATAPEDAGNTYPDSWYLRNKNGQKVRSDPWRSYLMDPRKSGWRDTVVSECEAAIDRSNYDGCYFDVMGTGALSIISSQPVISQGGPDITREQWHDMMRTLASHVRSNIPASTPLMSNSLTAGRRYFDDRYPSWQLGDAMGASHAEVWQRTAYKGADAFRTLQEYRWELEMLTDASNRGNPILLTTKLWVPVSESRRSQWRDLSYASFLMASDGEHYFGFTGHASDIEIEHSLYNLDIGVPTNSYNESPSGIFKRNFTKGLVITNAETSNRTVSLPNGTYVDHQGKTYSGSLQVKANSGIVLKRQGGGTTTTTSPTTTPPTTSATTAPTTAPPTTPAPPTTKPQSSTTRPASQSDLFCQGARVTIEGTAGNDVIYGTSGRDVIHGLSGDDVIRGNGGDDIICGGWGRDELRGGAGNDKLYGEGADDALHGDSGADRLRGGDGKDRMFGGNGNDDIRGNDGNDILHGSNGNDLLNGRTGEDKCYGGDGSDSAVSCEMVKSAS
jgi:hypothetical protein